MNIKNSTLAPGFVRDDKLIKELADGSDRASVVLGAAIIEELLERALKKRLVQKKSVMDKAFEGTTGSLGTFAGKIQIAYLSGLISEELYKDLEVLKSIRNKFAHNILGCDFLNPVVLELCHRFILVKSVFKTDSNWKNSKAKELFILEIMALQTAMIRKITRTTSLEPKEFETGELGFEEPEWAYLDGQESKEE
ncbi:MltR family transcriptional regulator [Rufibacter sediminis]|uniref:MltR family transcriptional regulator n=1 Tax=Rufibacter sediminis TaxID=2762756 RepID=UPI002109B740|nr:MltR family transcriptional regulator [Rufibacter sediminis]